MGGLSPRDSLSNNVKVGVRGVGGPTTQSQPNFDNGNYLQGRAAQKSIVTSSNGMISNMQMPKSVISKNGLAEIQDEEDGDSFFHHKNK